MQVLFLVFSMFMSVTLRQIYRISFRVVSSIHIDTVEATAKHQPTTVTLFEVKTIINNSFLRYCLHFLHLKLRFPNHITMLVLFTSLPSDEMISKVSSMFNAQEKRRKKRVIINVFI